MREIRQKCHEKLSNIDKHLSFLYSEQRGSVLRQSASFVGWVIGVIRSPCERAQLLTGTSRWLVALRQMGCCQRLATDTRTDVDLSPRQLRTAYRLLWVRRQHNSQNWPVILTLGYETVLSAHSLSVARHRLEEQLWGMIAIMIRIYTI